MILKNKIPTKSSNFYMGHTVPLTMKINQLYLGVRKVIAVFKRHNASVASVKILFSNLIKQTNNNRSSIPVTAKM